MTSKAISIKDVADAAGVSVTTVSHVLNNVTYARISPVTRERVKTVAGELGYGPNRLAQALRTQRSGMLGFISEEIATTPPCGPDHPRCGGDCPPAGLQPDDHQHLQHRHG